jgi:hypothetical protein
MPRDTRNYFTRWAERRGDLRRAHERIKHQRADLRRMHEALEDRNREIERLLKSRNWHFRLVREARAEAWKQAEKRHDTSRKNIDLHHALQLALAEDKPWQTPGLRVVVNPHKSSRTIHVAETGRCAVCKSTGEKLTNHHVFGRTMPLVLRACKPCHEGFHNELRRKKPGPHTAAMTRTVAEAFAKHDTEVMSHAG